VISTVSQRPEAIAAAAWRTWSMNEQPPTAVDRLEHATINGIDPGNAVSSLARVSDKRMPVFMFDEIYLTVNSITLTNGECRYLSKYRLKLRGR
jgi:hypothetical protein